MGEPRLAGSTAIVVLGCRIPPSFAGGGAARRRAEAAAKAASRLGADLVVASGGRRWSGVAEADFIANALESYGVARSHIARELCSLSTAENAWYSREILRAAAAG